MLKMTRTNDIGVKSQHPQLELELCPTLPFLHTVLFFLLRLSLLLLLSLQEITIVPINHLL